MENQTEIQRLLTPQEASIILGVTTGTLNVWRSQKRYPLKYIKVGHLVRYHYKDLQEFMLLRAHSGLKNPVLN